MPSNTSRGQLCILAALIILLSVLLFRSRVFLNWGQLLRLQGGTPSQAFSLGLNLAPDDVRIRWQAARFELKAGRFSDASRLLSPLIGQAAGNPLLFADVLQALQGNGQFTEAITLYEKAPALNRSPVVSETMVMAYLDAGQFDKVIAIRPDNLTANFMLWQRARKSSDPGREQQYRNRLERFSLDAIRPARQEMLRHVVNVIPDLIASRIWTCETGLRVYSYLSWQFASAQQVAEAINRGGAKCDTVENQRLQRESEARRAVISAYGVDANKTSNGERVAPVNLLESTSDNVFNPALNGERAFWGWGAYTGADQNAALFTGGQDAFESDSAVRMTGLWNRATGAEKVPPYAEFVSQSIELDPGAQYELSLRYKTDPNKSATAFVAFLDYSTTPRSMFVHTGLPDTAGQWSNWNVRGVAPSERIGMQVLLRMHGTGNVWFDRVKLVKVVTE